MMIAADVESPRANESSGRHHQQRAVYNEEHLRSGDKLNDSDCQTDAPPYGKVQSMSHNQRGRGGNDVSSHMEHSAATVRNIDVGRVKHSPTGSAAIYHKHSHDPTNHNGGSTGQREVTHGRVLPPLGKISPNEAKLISERYLNSQIDLETDAYSGNGMEYGGLGFHLNYGVSAHDAELSQHHHSLSLEKLHEFNQLPGLMTSLSNDMERFQTLVPVAADDCFNGSILYENNDRLVAVKGISTVVGGFQSSSLLDQLTHVESEGGGGGGGGSSQSYSVANSHRDVLLQSGPEFPSILHQHQGGFYQTTSLPPLSYATHHQLQQLDSPSLFVANSTAASSGFSTSTFSSKISISDASDIIDAHHSQAMSNNEAAMIESSRYLQNGNSAAYLPHHHQQQQGLSQVTPQPQHATAHYRNHAANSAGLNFSPGNGAANSGLASSSSSSEPDMEEINTRQVAARVAAELKRYSVPQSVFAQLVLCRSQGTLSDLLRNPKPWSKLKSGRETFRRMWKWLQEPEYQRMATLRLAGRLSANRSRNQPPPSTPIAADVFGNRKPPAAVVNSAPQPPAYQPMSGGPSSNAAAKKPRLVFTDIQRRTLLAIFCETRRPSKDMQALIADQLGLKISTVANFFMNARRRSTEKYTDDDDDVTAGQPALRKNADVIGLYDTASVANS